MQKNNYNYDDLISCGEGKLFGEGNAKLPLPPMLMFDRITEINQNSGEFKKVNAIHPDNHSASAKDAPADKACSLEIL